MVDGILIGKRALLLEPRGSIISGFSESLHPGECKQAFDRAKGTIG